MSQFIKFAALGLIVLGISADQSHAFPGTGKAYYPYPTFVQETEFWNVTSTTSTASFNVRASDVLVALVGKENGTQAAVTVSGGSLTWTKQQEVHAGTNWADAAVWTAVVDVDKSMTVTITSSTSGDRFGVNVLTFRNTGGVGASAKTNVSGGAPTLNITTTKPNSAIVVFSEDWTAVNGSARTWRTNAGAFTEQTYDFQTGSYTSYGGFHPNAGPINTYAVGLSAPAGQTYSIVAVEIKAR